MWNALAGDLRWATVSQISRIAGQLLSMLVLARLLPATDFGLVAMATVATGFANLFRDLGTASAIIQKLDPSPILLDSLFWVNVGVGLALSLSLLAASPLIAFGFSEPRVTGILGILVITFPIFSLGVVHQALMEKQSLFRQLAIIESITVAISLSVGIIAAWYGLGVYSLILQTIVSAIVSTIGLWIVSKWRPSCRFKIAEIRRVIGFSINLVGYSVFNYATRNADNMLIGRFLGATDLGYYSMAYRLMLWPLQNIASVVTRVLFPAFSRMQANTNGLIYAYSQATAAIVLITAPLMFGFFVLREPFVAVLLGDQWLPVSNLLGWLIPVGLLQSIGTTVGTLYLATGRTDVMFKWGIGAGLLVIPAYIIGLQWGINGVACAYAVASLILFYPGLMIPFQLVGLRVGKVLKELVPTIVASAVMSIFVAIIAAQWQSNSENQVLRFIILIIVGTLTYGALTLAFQRSRLKRIIGAAFSRGQRG